jgi:transposase
MRQRKYTKAFKEEIVKALLDGANGVKLSREFKVSRGLIYRWREQALSGELGDTIEIHSNPETRINELERMVGKLFADNELLKKALKQTKCPPEENEILSGNIEIEVDPSQGGAQC